MDNAKGAVAHDPAFSLSGAMGMTAGMFAITCLILCLWGSETDNDRMRWFGIAMGVTAISLGIAAVWFEALGVTAK